ncbi:MAG: B12-binding domain-containing radical SAM protein, partial [Candidatus Thorarchaeota archaeon]
MGEDGGENGLGLRRVTSIWHRWIDGCISDMKVTLISPYSDVVSIGVRILSACLRRGGYQTQLIFLPRDIFEGTTPTISWDYRYADHIVSNAADLCHDSDLIGISLMTNYFYRVADFTQKLKEKSNVPIAWGGVHPTIRPEECLGYADMVCLGESEEALLELVQKIDNGYDYFSTENFWFKRDGNIIRNSVRPLIQNLDTIPFPDYDLDEDFVIDKDGMRKMDVSILKKYMERVPTSKRGHLVYVTMASRGCPHDCAYCNNSMLKRLYSGQKMVRRRNPENIVGELLQAMEKIGSIGKIAFRDDSFFAASSNEIRKFSELYKEEIGLPFHCQTSPLTISEKKMEYLIDAGLRTISMGIETGSERTKKLYNRNITNERVINAAILMNKYIPRLLPPTFDVLIDNPYETDDDLLDTLDLLMQLPRPYRVRLFSLVFFPGTALHDKAVKDNLIKDELKQIYFKHARRLQGLRYLKFVFYLIENNLPKRMVGLMVNRKTLKVLNRRGLNGLYRVLYNILSHAAFQR